VLPVAPRGRVAMLSDYIDPGQNFVTRPNQDVVYGLGYFSLDEEPVVAQVPDFGSRFWTYALYDARTDQFGNYACRGHFRALQATSGPSGLIGKELSNFLPLPKKVIEAVLSCEHLNLKGGYSLLHSSGSVSYEKDDEAGTNPLNDDLVKARRGISQGSAASPFVAEALLSSTLHQIPKIDQQSPATTVLQVAMN
jgi:Protein of unknown function (DUF1254)